jgi:predicted nuclease of predicted toxin-antitoxin system
VKFKLDENLPASSAAILASAGDDVDTVADEALAGAPDQDVVAAATAAGRILISLDRGSGISAPTRPAAMPASLWSA